MIIQYMLTNIYRLMYYKYDEWGRTASVSDIDSENDWIELANTNPLRYRGYYLDSETGYYYLQSRYYDPSICRFINADIADIAYECREELIGTNLFVYCCNDPVNHVDYTGYWGEAVHNGYNKNTTTHYMYTSVNGKSTPYGTYHWAIFLGFSSYDAEILAKKCNKLDDDYSSCLYTMAVLSSNYYTYEQICDYYTWQGYHFNINKTGKDSREVYADMQMDNAVTTWKKAMKKTNKEKKRKTKNLALVFLGFGLHAMQDIEAHGNIGKGKSVPQHVVSDIKSKRYKADKINYDWSNSGRTSLKESGSKKRLVATYVTTRDYVNRFIKSIGGKSKLK